MIVIERGSRHEQMNCPICGYEMILQTTRRGRNAGKQFYGCSQWKVTGCKSIVNIDESDTTNVKYKLFEEARLFVRALGLQTEREWRKYIYGLMKKLNRKPKDIPANPDLVYKDSGWIDYADWIGVEYADFNTSREFVRDQKFNNDLEYDSYFRRLSSLKIEDSVNIPFKPDVVYKDKGWNGWHDWLGIDDNNLSKKVEITQLDENYFEYPDEKDVGYLKVNDTSRPEILINPFSKYYTFTQSREFMNSIKLKSFIEWEQYKSGLLIHKGIKPEYIPPNPDVVYAKKGWRGWYYWFGYDMIPFKKAREFARSLKLKSIEDWFDYTLGSNKYNLPRQLDIPDNPVLYYNYGWSGWQNWLGVKTMKYNEAKSFVRLLKLSDKEEWEKYIGGEILPMNPRPLSIPKNPALFYKNKGWEDWCEFLGLDKNILINEQKLNSFEDPLQDIEQINLIVREKKIGNFRTFQDAREFVRSLDLMGENQWYEFALGLREFKTTMPADIPIYPSIVYKDKGWIGFKDWLGLDKKKIFK